MRKVLFTGVLLLSFFCSWSQSEKRERVSLSMDLSHLKELPTQILVQKTSLGNYTTSKTDTCSMKGKIFSYDSRIFEPELFEVAFHWTGDRVTTLSFWATLPEYTLGVDEDMNPVLTSQNNSDFVVKVEDIDQKVSYQRQKLDSLLKTVSYENKKIADVERRLNVLRDSIDNEIDEHIFRKYFAANLSSAVGLYALCMYADRPYSNQRIKSDPEKILQLFHQLDPDIQKMPSAVILFQKLNLGQRMEPGKMLADISLPDTVGKMVSISSFKGKYLLVDFWASWCMPCRQEIPVLIKAYRKFKDLGFQIVSITLDSRLSKHDWLQAIKEDHISIWTHLSDFDSLTREAYGVKFIPANYLIDPDGVIIARDLRGEDLESKLTKYLNKDQLVPR